MARNHKQEKTFNALGSVMSILQDSPCCLYSRRKNFTQPHTLPFRKVSEVGQKVKEGWGRVQADKQQMKGWAEGDRRVECGPHRRDATRL